MTHPSVVYEKMVHHRDAARVARVSLDRLFDMGKQAASLNIETAGYDAMLKEIIDAIAAQHAEYIRHKALYQETMSSIIEQGK